MKKVISDTKTPPLSEVPHIVIHGWRYTEDGSQEHTYEGIDGYCVYYRFPTPDHPQHPFDIDDEMDFTHLDSARIYAGLLKVLKHCKYVEEDL